VGFDDYLRNEGMVSRVVATYDPVNEQIDIDRLLTNIDKVYKYDSIFDPKVYKDDNMKRLVMNYGSGFSRAPFILLKIINLRRQKSTQKRLVPLLIVTFA